jgi:hypothetical protein
MDREDKTISDLKSSASDNINDKSSRLCIADYFTNNI